MTSREFSAPAPAMLEHFAESAIMACAESICAQGATLELEAAMSLLIQARRAIFEHYAAHFLPPSKPMKPMKPMKPEIKIPVSTLEEIEGLIP